MSQEVSKSEFLATANNAVASVTSFAKFVEETNFLTNHPLPGFFDATKEDFRRKWFDMEIVNANALSEWDGDGRPVDWNQRWEG
jgi:hypothetical protein